MQKKQIAYMVLKEVFTISEMPINSWRGKLLLFACDSGLGQFKPRLTKSFYLKLCIILLLYKIMNI